MKRKSFKKLVAKIILLSFFCSLLLSLAPIHTPKAQAWDAMIGAFVHRAIDSIWEIIWDMLAAAAKKAAIEMVMDEVNNMMGDSSETGEKFIRDWEDYIKTQPEKAAKKYMNDYLSNLTQGRGSSRYSSLGSSINMAYARNYEGFGGINEYQFALIQSAKAEQDAGAYAMADGLNRMYANDLKEMNDQITASDDESKPEITCTDEERNDMFSKGNFDAFWKCTSGINYAPLAYAQLAAEYETVKTLEKEKQNLKALATGYLPATQNGKVTTPAGTIEAIQNKAAVLQMEALAQADGLAETIASAVIMAIDGFVQEGIGNSKEDSQREDSNVQNKEDNQNQNEMEQSGPQSMFKSN